MELAMWQGYFASYDTYMLDGINHGEVIERESIKICFQPLSLTICFDWRTEGRKCKLNHPIKKF
jgi:hypothetical protein